MYHLSITHTHTLSHTHTHTHTHTHLQEGESQPSSFAQRHLHLAVTLYYKLLDAIMRDEERKNPDFGSLQVCCCYWCTGKCNCTFLVHSVQSCRCAICCSNMYHICLHLFSIYTCRVLYNDLHKWSTVLVNSTMPPPHSFSHLSRAFCCDAHILTGYPYTLRL